MGLYEKHGIWMWVEKGTNPDNFYSVIQDVNTKQQYNFKHSPNYWRDIISEAYEVGIEHILNNLI